MQRNQQFFREGWAQAVQLCEDYLVRPGKLGELFERADGAEDGGNRSYTYLVTAAVRHKRLIDSVIDSLVTRPPRARVRAVLTLGIAQMLLEPVAEKVVDSVVEHAKRVLKKPEIGFLNAVLRRVPAAIKTIEAKEDTSAWGIRYSHPDWLIQRWLDQLGEKNTRALLEWDQTGHVPTYVRVAQESIAAELGESLEQTQWPHFYRFTGKGWANVVAALNAGNAYIQDPSTRVPVELLAPKDGESILDLCAAPGGKSRLIADSIASGTLVAVDLPGGRLERLQENLAHVGPKVSVHILGLDVLEHNEEDFSKAGVPTHYDAVILDAPCSNTGVLRRRPDAKWRLVPEDITQVSEIQRSMIDAAAALVAPGGRLLYSTCSLESLENAAQVEAFLARNPLFSLEASSMSCPWEVAHDGGGAFLLRRKA